MLLDYFFNCTSTVPSFHHEVWWKPSIRGILVEGSKCHLRETWWVSASANWSETCRKERGQVEDSHTDVCICKGPSFMCICACLFWNAEYYRCAGSISQKNIICFWWKTISCSNPVCNYLTQRFDSLIILGKCQQCNP